MALSYGNEMFKTDPDPEREKVEQWLTGIEAVRQGIVTTFYLHEKEATEAEAVTVENVCEVENRLREHYGEVYPDLAIIDAEVIEIIGELMVGSQTA